MKVNRKYAGIILSILVVVLISVIGFILFRDVNRLNGREKKWLKDNRNTLIDIRIPNNINTFGINGSGVFFDFIDAFKDKYKLELNPISYEYGSVTPGTAFKVDNVISPNDILFFDDHYVLVSKNDVVINDISELHSKKIGLIGTDLSHVSYYFNHDSITFEQFNSLPLLVEGLSNLDYIVLPLNQGLDLVLEESYNIVFHFSDIKQYYYLKVDNNKTLLDIMHKHYNTWSKSNFDSSYNENLLYTFTRGLNLAEADLHSLTSKEYRYGVVENAPYEILTNNRYGGVIGKYLNGFIDMTRIDIKYSKYRSFENLNKVANASKLDLFFGFVKTNNKFTTIGSGLRQEYDIVANNKHKAVINSLDSLKGKTVYILEDTQLKDYFQSLNLVTIKTYKNLNDVFELVKKDNLVIMDSLTYSYYHNTRFKDTVSKFNGKVIYTELAFKSNLDPTFNRLFKSYVKHLDGSLMQDTGISDYNHVLRTNSAFNKVLKYIVYLVIASVLVVYIWFRYTNRIKISTKISRDSKMKYYDYLTTLKNRNYLNENIDKWNQNNIYPQTIVIIDLNNIKHINDTYGHEEGDKQIRAAANILIKTQLDNSEIIRTDGNEFLIYLVEYPEKQVSSYIHKLYKEFDKLPYEYGAALGYSIINDDLKLIDDAINEASLEMRTNKISGVKHEKSME